MKTIDIFEEKIERLKKICLPLILAVPAFYIVAEEVLNKIL